MSGVKIVQKFLLISMPGFQLSLPCAASKGPQISS